MRIGLPALCTLLLITAPVLAQGPAPEPPSRWSAPLGPVASRARARTHRGWRGFVARNPGWTARFDAASGHPVLAFGPGIPSLRPGALDGEVAAAALAWRDRLAPVRGQEPADLALLSVLRAGPLRTAHLGQRHLGVPVLDCGLFLHFDHAGRLVAWGGRVVPVAPAPPGALLPPAAAVARATAGLRHAGLVLGAEVRSRSPELVVLPLVRDGASASALCWRVLQAAPDRGQAWETFIDAHGGERVASWNAVRTCGGPHGPPRPASVTGTLQGTTHEGLSPRSPPQLTPIPETGLVVDGTPLVTDVAGGFTYVGGGSTVAVQGTLDGPWVDVRNMAGNDALLTTGVGSGVVAVTFDDTNSSVAERDVARFVNRTHRTVKLRAPGITVLDAPLVARVGLTYATCNAYYYPWDDTVNFLAASGSCVDSATSQTIVHHEVGHALTTRLWALAGRMVPGYLGEGLSDVVAAACTNVSAIGADLLYPGDPGRSLANACTWPWSCGATNHERGRVLGGAFWSTRGLMEASFGTAGRDLLDSRFFQALVAAPLDEVELLTTLLLLDDDDGDLTNGTPNLALFHQGFTVAHGIPLPLEAVSVGHAPLRDSADALQPYRVEAQVSSLLPQGVSGCAVNWSLDGVVQLPVSMAASPAGTWSATLPVQAPGVRIAYWIEALTPTGDRGRSPAAAPEEFHEFFAASRRVRLASDFEGSPAWTATSTNGIDSWERGTPSGLLATEPPAAFEGNGVWGNDLGLQPGSDGLSEPWEDSSLVSPPIDLSGLVAARVVFRRWLRVGTSSSVRAAVEVSAPGIPWTTLWENAPPFAPTATTLDVGWVRQALALPTPFAGQANVRLRFVLTSLQGVGDPGWNLDAVRVEGIPATPLLAGVGAGLPGTTWTLRVAADPGTPFLALADLATPTPVFLPGLGTTSLSPFSPSAVVLQGSGLLPAVVGPAGVESLALTVPTAPWLTGLTLGFQAVAVPDWDPARATISELVTLAF